jgi:hypothetical protein
MHHVTHLLHMAEPDSASSRGVQFLRAHFILILAVSAIVIIPCLWRRRIEAGDLPSHVYNAWLARLLEQGSAPGLYLQSQWTNMLFDLFLFHSAKLFGFVVGPAIVVAASALIFFWGVFSFVTTASGRPPWFLTPLLAMLTFGYTFNMGFFNFYLSIGLACFGLAFLWRPLGWDWLAGGLVFAVTMLAHPIGSLWYVTTFAYVTIRTHLRGVRGLTVPSAALGVFVALHLYLSRVAKFRVNWLDQPFSLFNGADQLVLYSPRYRWIAAACVAIALVWLACEIFRWREYSSNRPLSILSELYVVSFISIALLPQDMRVSVYSAWIGLLVSRLTIVSAIFALATLACLNPRKWVAFTLTGCALVFFTLLYRDTGALNTLESHAEALTANLPPGTLVIPVLKAPPGSRIPFIGHIVDRACIGHCFSYSNYEPSSGQFRLRARPGSPVVIASAGVSEDMAAGNYVVRKTDPTFKNIYQCDPASFTALCIRDLASGQKTGLPEDDPED